MNLTFIVWFQKNILTIPTGVIEGHWEYSWAGAEEDQAIIIKFQS